MNGWFFHNLLEVGSRGKKVLPALTPFLFDSHVPCL
jgi:hypothetical protein